MSGIFLDRGGAIILEAIEGKCISDWDKVEFLPGALEAIAEPSHPGDNVIVVTNQRGRTVSDSFKNESSHQGTRAHGGNVGETESAQKASSMWLRKPALSRNS